MQGTPRKMNGETARQQANREEDRGLKHLTRSRSREALPYVKEVCHNENYENRRLRDDQARHANRAAIRKRPASLRIRKRSADCAHFRSLTRKGCPDLPDVLDPRAAAGWLPLGSRRSYKQVVANSLTIPESTRPTDHSQPSAL